MSARERPPEGRDPRSVSEAAERLAAIVEAAEEAASRVIDDAEAEARRRLDDAEDRAERLVAEKLRALADEIDPPRTSGGTIASLRPVGPVEGEARETLPPEEPAEAAPIAPRRSGSAGARLLATQMAVSGASREEIEKRLQNGFEIDDASEILDAILGPEG